MMSPDSNDLSPRLSMRDIGDSLSSLSFDRSRELGSGFASVSVSPTATATALGSGHGSPTPQSPTVMTMSIREEDLWLLSDTLETALEGADQTLQGLESDRELLPSAILRKCEEFADGLGSLASELEGQSLEERRRLAEAIRDDLKLFEEVEGDWESLPSRHTIHASMDQAVEREHRIGDVRHDDDEEIARALSGASVLLRDVESAFRDIGKDEAEEIADAALIMARLFLLSLQNFHSSLLKQLTTTTTSDSPNNFKKRKSDRAGSHRDHGRSTVWIEELPSDDGDENDNSSNNDNDEAGQNKSTSQQRQRRPSVKTKSIHQQRRMRVLWPPLGPKVDTAMAWTKEEATKRPFLAVALGLTLWPVAISTALVGSSAVLIDGALQTAYERFREGPWISVVEEGAAQAYQAGRLTLATGKLVGKQSLRVASRQIERRGGLQPVLHDLGGMALDRITHPIDTMGKIWDGVHWGFGLAKEATDDFLMMRRESQDSLI